MLLPTTREVRDSFDPDVLTTEVLLTGEGAFVRGVKGRGAEGMPVEVLDLGGGVVDGDVLVIFVPRLHGSQSPLFGEALGDDVTDIEDLLDDQVVDGGAGIGSASWCLIASTGHDPREDDHS